MRSSHVDLYNHDEDAATYDQDVLRSEDPIREGYAEVLDWVGQNADITQDSTVVEFGSGTGQRPQRYRSVLAPVPQAAIARLLC